MSFLELPYHLAVSFYVLIQTTIWAVVKQFVPYQYRAKSVKDEIVLVTGAGSGLGRLMAFKFAKLGARLVLVDLNTESNEETANKIRAEGGRADTFTCDLSNREKIYLVADQIKKEVGDITFLVNNAGIVTGKKFLESSDVLIQKTMDVNINAHFWLAKSFLPSMLEKNHGHVVTIASMAGIIGGVGLSDYCASKFAAVGFDESLRGELLALNKPGIKTTVVCPYYISTGMFDGVQSNVLSILTPDYVVDKIIEAVLTDQRILFLPRSMYLLAILKTCTDVDFQNYFYGNVLKLATTMSTFVGRKKTQ